MTPQDRPTEWHRRHNLHGLFDPHAPDALPTPAWAVKAYDDAHVLRIAPLCGTGDATQRRPRNALLQEPPMVIFLRGIPGSGKSTWAAGYKKKYATETVIVSATDFFRGPRGGIHFRVKDLKASHAYCAIVFEWLTRFQTPRILVDNTHIEPWEYAQMKVRGRIAHYRLFQHVCTGTFRNIHKVAQRKVAEMRFRFQSDPTLPQYRLAPDGF